MTISFEPKGNWDFIKATQDGNSYHQVRKDYMNFNKWTTSLTTICAVSFISTGKAEDKVNTLANPSTTTLSGNVDVSMQWNPGTGNTFAPAYKYGGAGKADGFNLNAVNLSLERNQDGEGWTAGYKVDVMLGPDANVLATTSTFATTDIAIKQAYVSLGMPIGNGLNFKVGVFDSIIGYESTEAVNNPNFSRSFGYTFEPSTHTGILASYRVNDEIELKAGVANTLNPTINGRASFPLNPNFNGVTPAESYKAYMGSVALTAPNDWSFLSGSTLYSGIVNGFNNNVLGAGTAAEQTSFYVGSAMNTPITGLTVGMAYDYLGVRKQALTSGISAYANAVAGYASYKATEALSLHGRVEYASLSRGVATALESPGLLTGIASQNLSLTGTVQYDLWKNVLTRIELRWDHALDGGDAFGNPGAGGATSNGYLFSGSRQNSYIIAANFIYRF